MVPLFPNTLIFGPFCLKKDCLYELGNQNCANNVGGWCSEVAWQAVLLIIKNATGIASITLICASAIVHGFIRVTVAACLFNPGRGRQSGEEQQWQKHPLLQAVPVKSLLVSRP